MPRLLEDQEVDLGEESLDMVMTAADEEEAASFRRPVGPVGDLADGGMVGVARVYPTSGHRAVAKGRATARRAWMWDGTETVLPLVWNPEGTQNDGGRRYMSKRHCLCCGHSGFRGRCRRCENNLCQNCNMGTDKTKNIACFYLKQEQVPFPQKLYGSINCFLPFCPRRDGHGFKTEQDMRTHARTRHRMEYLSWQETSVAQQGTETDELKRKVAELTSMIMGQLVQTDNGHAEAPAEPEAPLYVSDKPVKPKKPGRRRGTRK